MTILNPSFSNAQVGELTPSSTKISFRTCLGTQLTFSARHRNCYVRWIGARSSYDSETLKRNRSQRYNGRIPEWVPRVASLRLTNDDG